ncbi:MAG TPA: endonuclease domain-containing protein [Thermoanaerobaculia bacterium]|nr:endonuclease domain-containing protein [Thermoanaerobaculia bacterium]
MRYQIRGSDRTNERNLRKGLTEAEQILWAMLRGRRLGRLKFRRQHRIDFFIVDFFCPQLQLAIELDGAPHFTDEGRRNDAIRNRYLEALGIRVIRFENRELIANAWMVEQRIARVVEEVQASRLAGDHATPHP